MTEEQIQLHEIKVRLENLDYVNDASTVCDEAEITDALTGFNQNAEEDMRFLLALTKTLQQQNKQLIEALEEIKDEEWRLAGEFTTIYTTAYYALQQIQGVEES